MKINELKQEILKRNPKIERQIKMDLAFQVGRMLTNARLSKGITQEALAKKIGTKQPAIARVESGSNLPNLSFLDKIAKKVFNTYLIPPRFAFMDQEDIYTKEGLEQKFNTISVVKSPSSYFYVSKYTTGNFIIK